MKMELPKYFSLIRVVAQVGAVGGIIVGMLTFFGAFGALFNGYAGPAMAVMFSGAAMVIAALGGLGIAYAFLALVEATIDTRNAIVKDSN